MRPHLLRRLGAEHENVLVADAGKVLLLLSLIERWIEQNLIGAGHDRAGRISFGAAERSGEEVDALLTDQAVRLLDDDTGFGLGVADDHLELAAKHAAGGVDLVDPQLKPALWALP